MSEQAHKPKRKRRWFRFSLRTFVVLLTVFCVWLGLLVYRVNKQREAAQWVKKPRDHIACSSAPNGDQSLPRRSLTNSSPCFSHHDRTSSV